jgi:hypothetical protein
VEKQVKKKKMTKTKEDTRNTLEVIQSLAGNGVTINVTEMRDGRVTGFFVNGADTQYVTATGKAGCNLTPEERDGYYEFHTVSGSRYVWTGRYTLAQVRDIIRENLTKTSEQINSEYQVIAGQIMGD